MATLAFGLHAEHVDELGQQLAEQHLIAEDLEHAGLDLGDVQQPLDQVGKVLAAAADDANGILAVRGQRGLG